MEERKHRPVSNLPFVSKLVEKIAVNQITEYIDHHNLLPVNQSSYRKFYSTETALVKVQSDILLKMDKQQVSLLIMLDLSAAFDTVDYRILFNTLETDFGLAGNVRKWLMSYLSNRQQRILINDTYSEAATLSCGVPQGSCLGPVLFIMYVGRLFKIISQHLPNGVAYADDTQLFLSFRPGNKSVQDAAVTAMENCICDIRAWMIYNNLKINDAKTEFFIIGSRNLLPKVDIPFIRVGSDEIKCADCVKNLGFVFDKHLSMDLQTLKVSKQAFRKLFMLKQIRCYLTREACESVVHAFITSQLDYCNILYYGASKKNVARLQAVQNAAARCICKIPKYAHITPVLKSLHWLPVNKRIEYKILLLVFKSLHGASPKYIQDMITYKESTGYNTRSNSNPSLSVPFTKHKSFGDRSFAHAAPKLWNSLPKELKMLDTLSGFKTKLKTHLFATAF